MAQNGSIVSGVAGRFATALMDLAEDERAVDEVERDLDRFNAMITESADLERLVMSPVFSAEEQARAVSAILDRAEIGGIAGNFIRLVARKRRLFVIRGMIAGYKALLARKRGITRAEVTVAEQPSDTVLDELRHTLRSVAGGDVAVDLKIDPAIIGGLIVQLGSRMVDASLRSKLNSIRLAMKEVG